MLGRADRLLRAPVFVVGCPRSGTTFVGEVLSAHPRVIYLNEPPEIMAYCPRVYGGNVSAEEAAAFYRTVYRRALGRRRLWGVRRLAEKCPRHVFVLPFLGGAFPAARFIHVLRDGRAVVNSLVKTGWLGRGPAGADGSRARYWVPALLREEFERTTDAGRASLAWDLHVRAGLAGRRFGPRRYVEIRYEDMLAEPERSAADLLRFAGLALDPAVGRFLDGVRRERTAAWQRELAPADRTHVETAAGALLQTLGYGAVNAS